MVPEVAAETDPDLDATGPEDVLGRARVIARSRHGAQEPHRRDGGANRPGGMAEGIVTGRRQRPTPAPGRDRRRTRPRVGGLVKIRTRSGTSVDSKTPLSRAVSSPSVSGRLRLRAASWRARSNSSRLRSKYLSISRARRGATGAERQMVAMAARSSTPEGTRAGPAGGRGRGATSPSSPPRSPR